MESFKWKYYLKMKGRWELLIETQFSDWNKHGAFHTAKEIAQQPRLWKDVYENLFSKRDTITKFLNEIQNKHEQVRIIFTGAGTSAFAGDTLLPYIKKLLNNKTYIVESIPTTNIVSNPYYYLNRDFPTIMISFARSGNSPESVAAIKLGEQIIKDFYEITLTCNPEGALAKRKQQENKKLVLFMPKDANDQGFAMTSSYTTMMLSALLLLRIDQLEQLGSTIEKITKAGEFILSDDSIETLSYLVKQPFQKLVYLGSGVFEGLSREASLKFLELSAGKIPTMFDTSLGFRHGPKSILDGQTMVIIFLSSNPYTRKYDLDILKEIFSEKDRGAVVTISSLDNKEAKQYSDFFLSPLLENVEDDIFLTFLYILYAQTFAMYKSIDLGFSPDNPSPSGIVNRVVQGVHIYSYDEK
jgi:tagatose-6-phosphate ketose/aldose isomerase